MRQRTYLLALAVALAALAGYLIFQPAQETAETPQAPTGTDLAFVSAIPVQDVPRSEGDLTPQLPQLISHGLPIEGCDDSTSTIAAVRNEQDLQQLVHEAVDALSASSDPEYLLAAALLDFEREDRGESELLARALAQLPDHPVALWHRLQHCSGADCDRDEAAKAAVAADPTNGMLWLEIASGHLREGDRVEAERALRRATASSRFDTYFYDYMLLIERGLAASTDFDYSSRIIFGIGVAAAVALPSFGEVSGACGSDENDAAVWAPLCDELGKNMRHRSVELISAMLGTGLRRTAAERLGDSALVASLERESETLVERYIDRQIRVGASALLQNDATVLRNYVDDFRAHGELGAVDRLVEAAERLRNDPTYDQCNFVIPVAAN